MKNSRTRFRDWAAVLASEARLSDVLLVSELASKYNLPVPTVRKALSRLADRGLASRVTKGTFLNKLVQDYSAQDFVQILRPDSYISLESALNHWGLSTQVPVALTCVTTHKGREYKTPEFAITFRLISRRLFWGFVERQTRYAKYRIAEPEKAVLDWIYLALQSGRRPHMDEIDFSSVDKQKLVRYAEKFPATVQDSLARSVFFEHFATVGAAPPSLS